MLRELPGTIRGHQSPIRPRLIKSGKKAKSKKSETPGQWKHHVGSASARTANALQVNMPTKNNFEGSTVRITTPATQEACHDHRVY
jgi:hypothetical protein